VNNENVTVVVNYGGRSVSWVSDHDIDSLKKVAVEGASLRILSPKGETLWATDDDVATTGALPEHAMYWKVAHRHTGHQAA